MRIVFLDRYSLGDSDLSPISSLGSYTEYENSTQEQVVERCAGADIIITNKVRVFAEQVDALIPSLKLICIAATGTNNVDIDYAARCGVQVRNVPAYATESVAEATFSMVLSLLRNTLYYDQYVREGHYALSGRGMHLGRSVSQIGGKSWGIIGLGNIGRRVADLAEAFGARVSYYSTSGQNRESAYQHLELDELLSSSDIVTIHAPLCSATDSLINYEKLCMMRRNAILVNVGRGRIVCEADLARALNDGVLAGAGLDVFEREPIDDRNPLLGVADPFRLILAPHSAWSSDEARKTLIEKISDNIITMSDTSVNSKITII